MQESGETYLETILLLEKQLGVVHSVDVAKALNYAKPSVSRGVSLLVKDDFLAFGEDKCLLLTEKGREYAEHIYERHRLLTEFFRRVLDVDEDVAAENACRIEHVMTQPLFLKVKEYVLSLENQD